MKLSIVEKKEIAKGTTEVSFDISNKEFHFQAGQYVSITLPQLFYNDVRGKTRNFSITSSPNDKKIRIAFRNSESGFKRTLCEMALGTEVDVNGPFGDMFLPPDHSSSVVFVAGGIGITPFRSMLYYVTEEKLPYNITLLYANKDKESAAYLAEFEDLSKQNPNFTLQNYFGNVDIEVFRKNISDDKIKTAFWYVIGPPTMAVATVKILYELGVEQSRMRFEEFGGYPITVSDHEQGGVVGLQMFQQAVANTTQHIIITDVNGVILYANAAVEKTTGFSPEEIIGNKPSLWGRQMSQEFYIDLWRTIKVEKKSFVGEMQNKRKNGEIYAVFANISPVINTKGEVEFFIGMELDISKQKEFERLLIEEKKKVEEVVVERTKELTAEKARLLASINSIPFGFLVADNDNRILLKNTVLSEMFKLNDKKELFLKDISDIIGKDFNLELEVARCYESKAVCEVKEIVFDKKILRGIIAPIIEKEDESAIGYVLLLEDVTEARSLERSRDEFFSIASHELRTPLTAIRGNSQMLKDDYKDKMVDSDMSAMINDIHESSTHLISIVNDFLEVSRLEQGRIEIKMEKFDLSELILKVMKDLESMTKQKGITIVYDPPDKNLSTVFSDKGRIEQILFNLLGNAIKFTSKGNIVIKVEKIGDSIKTSVTDSGLGISEANQSLLFRKFQQASENVLARDVTQGTGLGLYISRLIMGKLGGTIELEKSVLGEGSTFVFTLPVST